MKAQGNKISLNCHFGIEQSVPGPHVLGIDEVGRGCLAGPVVVAGVVFPQKFFLEMPEILNPIQDSKKVSSTVRERLYDVIHANAVAVAVASIEVEEIDRINILQATWKAAREVVHTITDKLKSHPNTVLMDGNQAIPGIDLFQKPIVRGDALSKTIAAASIVAKVNRDRFMAQIEKDFPRYQFDKHKGYGTELHCELIRKHGPSQWHRKSFLSNVLNRREKGSAAEGRAQNYLIAAGYKIISKNWRFKEGEIDLIATKDGMLHFFEIRSCAQVFDSLIETLFPVAKRRQVLFCIQNYMLRNKTAGKKPYAVHLVAVTGETIQPFWNIFENL